MNYIRQLHAFYHHIRRDTRLTSGQISLYLAMFQYWNYNRFQNPFPINRDDLMQLSKVGCGFVMVFVQPHEANAETKTHAKPLRLTVAVYRRTSSLSSTVAGTRPQFRRTSSIAFEASSQATGWTSVPPG